MASKSAPFSAFYRQKIITKSKIRWMPVSSVWGLQFLRYRSETWHTFYLMENTDFVRRFFLKKRDSLRMLLFRLTRQYADDCYLFLIPNKGRIRLVQPSGFASFFLYRATSVHVYIIYFFMHRYIVGKAGFQMNDKIYLVLLKVCRRYCAIHTCARLLPVRLHREY